MHGHWSHGSPFFEIGGVALQFFTFAFGTGALYTATKVNDRQAVRLREFEKEVTDARTELGRQQKRAARADAHVAELQRDVANAKTAQAKAEQDLLELQHRVKDRRLSGHQEKQLIEMLTPTRKGPVTVARVISDGEGREFAKDIDRVLAASGFATGGVVNTTPCDLARPVGLIVTIHNHNAVPSHAPILFKAFEVAGLHPTWGENETVPQDAVQVLIGNKP